VLTELADLTDLEMRARRLASLMAQCLQASLLVRFAPGEVADAYCASRLGGQWAGTFGTLPRGADLRAVVERTTPRKED
jgi:putative acyl-CoA dehydrogenase